MASETPEPVERFGSWLLHRMAQAVEAREVPADLLIDLETQRATAREREQAEGQAAAIQHIAGVAGVPEEGAAKTLAAIEAQPHVTRRLLLRRFVEAWLEGRRRANRAEQDG